LEYILTMHGQEGTLCYTLQRASEQLHDDMKPVT